MRKFQLLTVLATLVCVLMASAPAQAFNLFGWGAPESTMAPEAQAPAQTPAAADGAAVDGAADGAGADGAVPASASAIQTVKRDESPLIRVMLKSLKQPTALGLTLYGNYAVERDAGFRFASESALSVAVDGENLLLQCGGLTINMGPSFTLTRHASEGRSGILIHETERENLYVGDLTLRNAGGVIEPVVTLDIEDYLYGVVPYEMSNGFPMEALKAQAVAARTYALRHVAPGKAYDVVDTPTNQTFKGFDAQLEATIAAVDETRGVTGQYDGDYAMCYFTATNGGQTELPGNIWGGSGAFGYLAMRDDPYDLENPSSAVKTLRLSSDPAQVDARIMQALVSGLTEQMAALGYSDEAEDIKVVSIESATPVKPKFEGGRMYTALRVGMQVSGKRLYQADPTPNAQTTPLNVQELVPQALCVDLDFYGFLKEAYGLGLNGSDWEVLSSEKTADGFVLSSRRYGHGVGMSQRGAEQMAKAHGATWVEILSFYYPGMTLVRMDYARTPLVALSELPKSLGRVRARPTPAPTPAPLPALRGNEYYATVDVGANGSTLNVRDKAGTDGRLLGTYLHGQKVIVVGEVGNGWAQVKSAELSGYASMDYLKK
ncbi:MAG: SpoIID/LytB domain-containing protein [Clostridia bacterium]